MIRSAQLARPFGARLAFLFFTIVAVLVITTASPNSASASVDVGGYTYYTTTDLCKLTVTPKDAAQPVGATQTFTATLSKIGPSLIQAGSVEAGYWDTLDACAGNEIDLLEGVPVRFSVVSGPNAGKAQEVPLDANGVAKFDLTSPIAGVDVVSAALTLADTCVRVPDEVLVEGVVADKLPDSCIQRYGEVQQPTSVQDCPGQFSEAVTNSCPTVTLTDGGQVTWSAPPVPPVVVQESADPSLTVASFKRCVSHQFKIAPSYSGGTITSSTLFVDGKKKQTQNGSAPFTVNGRSYSAGKHNFEIVTVFSSGKAASKFGSFTRCAARVTVKRVSPKFTG